ncbi:hypothetical protein [Neokomagataea anthophila]|uniref:DUF2927 domain-containing protein n=1 Tax=Neokomagataea anthophila TaxID=2826925 RepID=A0ABS5E7L0_9PROT|nr:hypothetical protein [Neokomagataea anthophila]MBR0559905.1 hypothetical protein [Neokomagataea anthophila]
MKKFLRKIGIILGLFPTLCWAGGQENIVVHGVNSTVLEKNITKEIYVQRVGHIPKWSSHVCLNVFGLNDTFKDSIIHKMKSVGQDLSLNVSDTCSVGNVLILFTDQSDDVARQIEQQNPSMFRGYDADPQFKETLDEPTDDEKNAFLKSRAVRWLTSTTLRSHDNMPPLTISTPLGPIQAVQEDDPSMLHDTARRDFTLSIIIVDINRIKDEPWGMLSDLIALVAYMGPNLSAHYDDMTLLGVNNGPVLQGPTGYMTPYDKALLAALYNTDGATDAREAVSYMADKVLENIHPRSP